MQRKSQEAAERLNESDHSSDGQTPDQQQHSSSNQQQRTMDQQASTSNTHQPPFNQPQEQNPLVYSQHHHQVSSESSSSRESSPVRGSSNHQMQSTVNKEDFRSSSIASLRAKAYEHASKVFGGDRKLADTQISATVVKDTVVVSERPSIHCISSLF